ncbi:MAG: DUF4097 family beta strand repeat protein [Lachnospiraceae bacterium]|nr:DUF4097 family beta strand repeat protein [Lachnospiraceae bacterium]
MNTLTKILILVSAAALSLFFGGCAFPSVTNYIYDDAQNYTPGDRDFSEKIESIDIDYLSGDITLVESDTTQITLRETSRIQLDDSRKVHSWVDGSTLHIRYCASAKRLDLNDLDKKLTVTIPRDTELTLLKAELTSGDIDAGCIAKDINVSVTSGNVRIDQHGYSDTIRIDATSGDIELSAEAADKTDLKATSGNITVTADSITSLRSDATSGNGSFRFLNLPELSEIEVTSGDITVYIPQDADLTAQIETSSGDLYSDIEFTKNEDSYTCGNGKKRMKIDTSSGDVSLKTLPE